MKPRIITTIPAYNGERFILETLKSLARQSLLPDRIVVLDDGSTDATEEIVESVKGIPWEWRPGSKKYGLFGNFNRCLRYAAEADYLHILHQDDTIEPEFYAVMTGLLADCDGRGMAWCLDERIDEDGARLSISGKPDGAVVQLAMDDFLKQKAEISNQAFCATLLKTARLPSPCSFPTDMPILGDMVFWAEYGKHCSKLVHVRRSLAKYRWHGENATNAAAPQVKALVHDEWRTMENNERLRGKGGISLYRRMKLRGLLAVRAGIKAKRFRQLGNAAHAAEIARAGKSFTGLPLWLAGQLLVELRDLVVFKILKRPRHPKNIFS